VGENPTRQPLQPEATGATVEATKWLKPPVKRATKYGGSASVQAVTRVNAEQFSKRTLHRPTRKPYRGRLIQLGVLSDEVPQLLCRDSGDSMYTREARATREAPWRGTGITNRTPVRDRPGVLGWRRGP
jgi:hypothetical protein